MFAPLLLAASIASTPISSCSSAPKQAQTVAVIRSLEVAWSEAHVHGDTASLTCLLDPKFVAVSAKGAVHYRAQELAGALILAKRHVNYNPATAPVPAVYINGRIAISTGIFTQPGSNGAHGNRWTDIYRYDGSHWHAIFSQDSKF